MFVHQKLYVPNAQDSNALPNVEIYFQRQRYGRLCCGRQLDSRRNRRLATNFASNCTRDDSNASFLVGEGRTRSRFLLLFCVLDGLPWPFTFTLSVICGLSGAGRRLQAKWHGKQKDLGALSAVLDGSCCLRISWWRNLSILRISSQLRAFLSFQFWNPVTALCLCLILSLDNCSCICVLL